MEERTNEMRQQLYELAKSYTPEWNFSEENPDVGSVLGILIADMLEGSAKRLAGVMHKHKLQYMNRFDALLKEPISAARGYVQFTPVVGSEGLMVVPKGTELSADSGENEMIFQTMHDICLADSHLVSVIVADGRQDIITSLPFTDSFKAFDSRGENKAFHGFYVCYDSVLDGIKDLELIWEIQADTEEEAQCSASLLASEEVEISLLEPLEEGSRKYQKVALDGVTAEGSRVRLTKMGYTPQYLELEGKKGYFICVSARKGIPKLVLSGLRLGLEGEGILPDIVQLEGIDTSRERFSPFGTPMQLMAECRIDSEEVFSKRNAWITLTFYLDFETYEEKWELPNVDIDYKVVMKRPLEMAQNQTQAVKVCADRVVWEYLSIRGWKRLIEDGDAESLMNGKKKGELQLRFVCPEDMASAEAGEPRLRLRLMQAANIYKIPAFYQCPILRNLRFSYSYQGRERLPALCYSINNYHSQDCLARFEQGLNTDIFYGTERPVRRMYFCFDQSVKGMPFCMYLDLENYSDLPLDFTVEYGRKEDFKPIRIVDGTNGFLNSGILQFMISHDMEEREMFGKRGYFLRFTGYEKEYPEYRLPQIKGIYLNMVKVENQSASVEYFFIENPNESLTMKLKNENLKQLAVWVHERQEGKACWVEWKQASRSYERGRVYQADMAEGTVTFGAFAFSDIELAAEGPEIRIEHRNYRGEAANVEAKTIVTLRDSNRYVSEVVNPFPAYGGYDAYTEESTAEYISGMLRSRQRAVTEKDILDLLRQTSYSITSIRCQLDVDVLGNPDPGKATIAVLTREYDKGSHLFYEIREELKKKLEETGNFLVMGREIMLIQPHFLRLNVRVWLEKDNMENAYDLQNRTRKLLEVFINPLTGGLDGSGWRIGSFPRVSQILAWLRKQLSDAVVARLVVTAISEDRETEIKEDISMVSKSPFILPVSGEHVIHIDLK